MLAVLVAQGAMNEEEVSKRLEEAEPPSEKRPDEGSVVRSKRSSRLRHAQGILTTLRIANCVRRNADGTWDVLETGRAWLAARKDGV